MLSAKYKAKNIKVMALLHYSQPQATISKVQLKKPKQNNDESQHRSDQRTPRTSTNAVSQFVRSCWKLAKLYGERTTIHGFNRLFGEKEGKWERIIWLLTVIVALFGTIYVCLLLSQRFNEGKFETVVDTTRLPVYRIAFPVVTICNLNHLNWQRIEAAKQRFLPYEKSQKKLQLFEKIIATYDNVSFGNFEAFSMLKDEPVAELNLVNFSLVFEFMTWRCEEFLTMCRWRHSDVNCCEVFSKRRSKNSLCWAFNSLETVEGRRMQRVDPLWPWRTGSAGPKSALNVRVLINPENHFPNRTNAKGLSVMITEPLVWHKKPFTIPENTETFMEIEPVIYFFSNETRRIPSNQRECVFNDETTSSDFKSLHNYIYMIENCESECHQEYLMRYCNCTLDLLFPAGQYPACKPSDLPCLAEKNERFRYSHKKGEEKYVRNLYDGMKCQCYRNCHSLNHIVDVRPSFLPLDIRKNTSYVDLDVHFRFETMIVYRTSLVFDWMDLMVAFGGIAGLFLGCSLISGVELIYFIFVETPRFFYVRLTPHRRPIIIHQSWDDDKNNDFTQRNLSIVIQGNRLAARNHDIKKLEQLYPESGKRGGIKFKEAANQLAAWNRLTHSKDLNSHYYN